MQHTIITSSLVALLLSAPTGLACAASPPAAGANGAAAAPGAAAATSAGVNTSATTSTPSTLPALPSLHGPAATGQPNQSCGSATAPNTPGSTASAPGSAFNPNGKAGSVYAGQQPQTSHNTASVSQNDAACPHQK